jgi:hypothetical protein
MIVTFFSDHAAADKRERDLSLDDLAELIREAMAPSKEQLPWLKLARFGECRKYKENGKLGSLRNNEKVVATTGVEGDYDAGEIGFDDAVETLEKAGIQAIVYTSPSHTPQKPRWRVLCPFSAELPASGRDHMMARLHGLFRGAFAPESWVLSQSYYYGSVGDGVRAEVTDATTTIDLADELDEIAIRKPNRSMRANGEAHRLSEPQAPIEDIAAALAIIPNPDLPWDGEGGWNYVGMASWSASGGSQEGLAAFVDWSRKSRKFDTDETERRWRDYANSPPNELSFGTLVFLGKPTRTGHPLRGGGAPMRLRSRSPPDTGPRP